MCMFIISPNDIMVLRLPHLPVTPGVNMLPNLVHKWTSMLDQQIGGNRSASTKNAST